MKIIGIKIYTGTDDKTKCIFGRRLSSFRTHHNRIYIMEPPLNDLLYILDQTAKLRRYMVFLVQTYQVYESHLELASLIVEDVDRIWRPRRYKFKNTWILHVKKKNQISALGIEDEVKKLVYEIEERYKNRRISYLEHYVIPLAKEDAEFIEEKTGIYVEPYISLQNSSYHTT